MNESIGFLSIIPPLLSIFMALIFRQVHLSLAIGIFSGWFILNSFNPFLGLLEMLDSIVDVFKDAGNTKTLLFCILVGGIIQLIKDNGGVVGFVNAFTKKIDSLSIKSKLKNRLIQVLVVSTGTAIFIESSISCLATGTLFRPIFTKYKISKAKLAYLVDSSSAPASMVFPFNGWGAFIISLLIGLEVENPVWVLIGSLLFGFYPFLTILVAFISSLLGIDFSLMKKTQKETIKKTNNKEIDFKETMFKNAKPSFYAMFLPILFMTIMMPLFMVYTGLESQPNNISISDAFLSGSGSSSVLYSVSVSLIFLVLYSVIKKQDNIENIFTSLLKGFSDIFPLIVLMVFAFALNSLCKKLGTGVYASNYISYSIPKILIPSLVFLVSAITSFSTGTSWGTFAIIMPIGVALANATGFPVEMLVASVIGGGIFGDHSSPISDTSILSSMASDCDHILHVKTQLPYAIFCGTATMVLLTIVSFFLN